MTLTLRTLLIQRAARLQERPALSAPDWGTLSYAQFRNRVEGVALGLLEAEVPAAVFSATGSAWDWAAEVAAAASGLAWDIGGPIVSAKVLGGPQFNAEGGRGPYHHREEWVSADTSFAAGLSQGELVRRLQRLNIRLGWDHETRVELPLASLAEPALRGALWSALYAGAHAVLVPGSMSQTGLATWDPLPFLGLLIE